MMGNRFEILQHLKDHKDSKPSERVSVSVGELRDLVVVIRCETLNLTNGYTESRKQATYRLKYLYQELTGLDINNGFWLIGETEGEATKTDD